MIGTTEIVQIGSLGLTSVSVLIAVSLYRRGRHLEYKNHLYKVKLDAFSNIAYEMERLLNFYNKQLDTLNKLTSKEVKANAESLYSKSMEADDFVYEFSNRVVKYACCFPGDIVNQLSNITQKQFGANPELNDMNQALKLMETFIDDQIDRMNNVYVLIREDLNLDKMNGELFRR